MDVVQQQLFKGFSSENYNKSVLYDAELITRDLQNHFYTKRGERVMNPEFGTIIWDLLFDQHSTHLENKIRDDVVKVISADPRVKIDAINVTPFDYGIIIEADLTYIPLQAIGTFSFTFDQRAITNGVAT